MLCALCPGEIFWAIIAHPASGVLVEWQPDCVTTSIWTNCRGALRIETTTTWVLDPRVGGGKWTLRFCSRHGHGGGRLFYTQIQEPFVRPCLGDIHAIKPLDVPTWRITQLGRAQSAYPWKLICGTGSGVRGFLWKTQHGRCTYWMPAFSWRNYCMLLHNCLVSSQIQCIELWSQTSSNRHPTCRTPWTGERLGAPLSWDMLRTSPQSSVLAPHLSTRPQSL